MGTFSVKCGISNKVIKEDERAVVLFLQQQYFNHKVNKNQVIYADNIFVHPNELYTINALGIRGTYDGYGRLEEVDSDLSLKFYLTLFEKNTVEEIFEAVDNRSLNKYTLMFIHEEVYNYLISDKKKQKETTGFRYVYNIYNEKELIKEYIENRNRLLSVYESLETDYAKADFYRENRREYGNHIRPLSMISTDDLEQNGMLSFSNILRFISLKDEFEILYQDNFDDFYEYILQLSNFIFTVDYSGQRLVPSIYSNEAEIHLEFEFLENIDKIGTEILEKQKYQYYND